LEPRLAGTKPSIPNEARNLRGASSRQRERAARPQRDIDAKAVPVDTKLAKPRACSVASLGGGVTVKPHGGVHPDPRVALRDGGRYSRSAAGGDASFSCFGTPSACQATSAQSEILRSRATRIASWRWSRVTALRRLRRSLL